jgi:multiple sugar transport system substrate-binding protein
MTGRLRVALVGGPMYDDLYALDCFSPSRVEVIVHDDHPTLNRRVAELLRDGERIDVLSTHSKYAPSQERWLRPLDGVVPTHGLAPGAVELCRFRGALLCVPRNIDVRVVWARVDRLAEVPESWDALRASRVVFGFPGRESGLFGTLFEIVRANGGDLFDADARPTIDTPLVEAAIATLVALAARAPADLPDWHYDELDHALLDGRIDASGAWPGAWGAIRTSPVAQHLRPFPYPRGSDRRAVYSGCHAWAIPTTCADVGRAAALVTELAGFDPQAHDARGGTICAHEAALASVEPSDEVDSERLTVTRRMIDEAMITFPPLERFDLIEDAGWSAVNAALRGELSPVAAARAIQTATEAALA